MKIRNCLRIAVLPTLALATSAQTLKQSIPGPPGFRLGSAVHVAGDLNGDVYPDVLVGAPGSNGGGGSLRLLSGLFLQTSVGVSELWSLTPSVPANAGFGAAIIAVGSLTGSNAIDYVVSAPDYRTGFFPTGALILIDGATHTVAGTLAGYPNTRTGTSLAAVGDQDGDGKIDFATTAPSTNSSASWVHVISGASFSFAGSVAASTHSSLNSNSAPEFGAVVSSGFDLDHDGHWDLAVGSPDFLGNGTISIWRADGSWLPLASHVGQQPGERFGAALDGRRDFDGDGTVDFVVGSPDWDSPPAISAGRAVVLSGAKLLAATLPYELFAMGFSPGGVTPSSNVRFGASVCATADLNGDSTPDVIVGAPGYISTIPTTTHRGGAVVFSGATATRLVFASGAGNEQLGDVLGDWALDLNFDGFPEFAVAGSLSDTPSTDCGTVKFFGLFPVVSTLYCTGKLNSAGCTPSLVPSGLASFSSPSSCTVTCVNLLNQKSGLFVYSHTPKATPFQGGLLCVGSPIRRTASTNSGGSTSGNDCSGSITLDVNARIQGGFDLTLIPGAEMFCQCWSRDPASPGQTSLSNGVRFVVNP